MPYMDPLEKIEGLTRKTNDYMYLQTRSAFSRYPLLFSFLTVFGVVCMAHGIQSIIPRILFLAEHPFRVLALGLLILIFTGQLYKKLDRKKLD